MIPDHKIRTLIQDEWIEIEPFDPSAIQPASIDMRLDRHFRWYPKLGENNVPGIPDPVDPKSPKRLTISATIHEDDHFKMYPGAFVLASTIERITFPDDIGGRIEGKSSLGRMGLFVHVTAGFIDPGFSGQVTLELYNANPNPILLYPGMKICQMSFHSMDSPCEKPYGSQGVGSKYTGVQAEGPVESMYFRNFQGEDRG